jgi:hypothetical protein
LFDALDAPLAGLAAVGFLVLLAVGFDVPVFFLFVAKASVATKDSAAKDAKKSRRFN